MISLLLTAVLYVLVTTAAVLAVTPAELADAKTPLAVLVSNQGQMSQWFITCVSMLAGVNGALVQIIMASRVAYGMSRQEMGPKWLGRVHPRTRTPVAATVLATLLAIGLALWSPLETLARVTTAITLVNAALVVLKRRSPEPPAVGPCHSIFVPILGCATYVSFLAFQIWTILREAIH